MARDEVTASKAVGCFGGVVSLLVTLPIWFFLLYQILSRIEASTAMWAAYWVYVPVSLLVSCATHVAKELFSED